MCTNRKEIKLDKNTVYGYLNDTIDIGLFNEVIKELNTMKRILNIKDMELNPERLIGYEVTDLFKKMITEITFLVNGEFKKIFEPSVNKKLLNSLNKEEIKGKIIVKEYYSFMTEVAEFLIDELNIDERFEYIKEKKIYDIKDNKPKIDRVEHGKYKKICFLSHAYEDRAYCYGLYLIFKDTDTLLYVDWMHSEKAIEKDDFIELKKKLSNVLLNSDYFLFLRTISSELHVRGNHQIRQWCSWEIGNFYGINTNKYCISTVEENSLISSKVKEKSNISSNMLLADFNICQSIVLEDNKFLGFK